MPPATAPRSRPGAPSSARARARLFRVTVGIVRYLRHGIAHACPELVGFCAQLRVGQSLNLRPDRIDGAHLALVLPQQPLVTAAEDLFQDSFDHPCIMLNEKGWGNPPHPFGNPCLNGQPCSRKNRFGFTDRPFCRTSKCRWAPVARPVFPTLAICTPRTTRSPTFTNSLEACA